jgi:hypothetical protein
VIKRVGEIKARRERAFFKHRLVISELLFSYHGNDLFIGWLQVEKNNELIAKRPWKQSNLQSNSTNPYQRNPLLPHGKR